MEDNMIKRLARSIRQYKKDSILAPILVTMEVVMEVIIPLLMAELIDRGIEQGNMNVKNIIETKIKQTN